MNLKYILSAATIGTLALGLTLAPAKANSEASHTFKGQLVRSSNLIGAELMNPQGKNIGQLNDIVFDENTGAMMHPILSVGGFLGIGDKLTPVTWDNIKVKKTDDNFQVMTTLDKTQLTQEKSYEKTNWLGTDKGWMKELPNTSKKLVRMSQADEAKLFDMHGTEIGAIKDIVLDVKSGKVAYAVVSFDASFIDKGDQMTMVPWTLVRQSEKDTPGYVLHTDKAKLEGATFFAPNAFPDMHDLTWNKEVYDHFAVTPYYWTGV